MSSVQILSNLNYPIGKVINEGLRNSLDTHIAVAFLKYSGVEVIQDALINSLEKGAEFEIIVGFDFKTTDSKSIRFLLDLNKTYKKVKHPNAKAIGLPRLMLPIGKVWFSLCVPNHRDFTEFELQRIPYRSHTSYLQRRNFAHFLR